MCIKCKQTHFVKSFPRTDLRMFSLVADYSATSSSSDSENSDDAKQQQRAKTKTSQAPPNKPLLPSANLLLNPASKSSGVVFNNPFLEAEKSEIDRLQKHVKMVESEEHMVEKNGRKICWNNRKGRCRFGNKCKYAHDSDLVEVGSSVPADSDDKIDVKHFPPIANPFVAKNPQLSLHLIDSPGDELKFKSRKRPGLGDSIVPGKKVMKHYRTTKPKTPS